MRQRLSSRGPWRTLRKWTLNWAKDLPMAFVMLAWGSTFLAKQLAYEQNNSSFCTIIAVLDYIRILSNNSHFSWIEHVVTLINIRIKNFLTFIVFTHVFSSFLLLLLYFYILLASLFFSLLYLLLSRLRFPFCYCILYESIIRFIIFPLRKETQSSVMQSDLYDALSVRCLCIEPFVLLYHQYTI